jgi:RsmE family RNA methyltransferase
MQFVYHPSAGLQTLRVDTREYEHIFKVRRISVGETLWWRNLEDSFVYEYQISQIGKKEAELECIGQKELPILSSKVLSKQIICQLNHPFTLIFNPSFIIEIILLKIFICNCNSSVEYIG